MERVIAVGVHNKKPDVQMQEKLDEFIQLLEAADCEVIAVVEQTLAQIKPDTVIGKGKVEEIASLVEQYEVDAVAFHIELSGSQIRSLEESLHCKVVDRTQVVLDIFAQRATEREGKLQVKLAQLSYRLPRLVGYRSYLSRTGGGIGTRGPGEQQIETDRRHIEREMQQIRHALKEVEATRSSKRKRRSKSSIPLVAVLGYTNAGKSTLLNGFLRRAEVKKEKWVSAKNQLFATLSPSHRQGIFPNGRSVLFVDTVGFVSDLPTELVSAFRSTLEDAKHADLIVHVLDGVSSMQEIQIETTMDILRSLSIMEVPRITVINKMDLTEDPLTGKDLRLPNRIPISAHNRQDIDRVLHAIQEILFPLEDTKVFVPYTQKAALRQLHATFPVNTFSYNEKGVSASVPLREEEIGGWEPWIQRK